MNSLLEMRSHVPLVHQKAVKGKRTRLAPISKRQSALLKQYAIQREKFLKDHPYCQWWLRENLFKESDVLCVIGRGPVCGRRDGFRSIEYRVPAATEVHHTKGRGKYLLDTTTWVAVSAEGHRAIHADPKKSYAKGYMVPR